MRPQRKRNNKLLGNTGENIACKYLKRNNFKILKRNFLCAYGEIDIIATYENILYFFEVKTRESNKYGDPIEAVTAKKIKSIKQTALLFAKTNNLLHKQMRFEVLSIEKRGNKYNIKIFNE